MKSHYQNMLIIYLKFIKRNAKYAWKKEKSGQNAILLGLHIINFTINVKNAKEDA